MLFLCQWLSRKADASCRGLEIAMPAPSLCTVPRARYAGKMFFPRLLPPQNVAGLSYMSSLCIYIHRCGALEAKSSSMCSELDVEDEVEAPADNTEVFLCDDNSNHNPLAGLGIQHMHHLLKNSANLKQHFFYSKGKQGTPLATF